jgi:hypothetical protein
VSLRTSTCRSCSCFIMPFELNAMTLRGLLIYWPFCSMRFKTIFVMANILVSSNTAPIDHGDPGGTCHLIYLRLLLFLCLASEFHREWHIWSGEHRRDQPSRCSLRCPLRLLLQLLLRVSAAPIICGMGVFSYR